MKATAIVAPVILASSVLLAGCTNPLTSLQSKLPMMGGANSGAPQGKLEQVAEAGKLSMMIATGKSGKCVITDKTNNSTSEYFIKGKKMKFSGTGLSSVNNPEAAEQTGEDAISPKPVKSFFLNDTAYTYIWTEGAKTGIKTKVPSLADTKKMVEDAKDLAKDATRDESPANNPEIQKFETDTNYTVNCTMMDLNDSDFLPPADVTFVDFNAMNQKEMMKFSQEDQTEPSSAPELTGGANKMAPKLQGKSMEKVLPSGIEQSNQPATDTSDE